MKKETVDWVKISGLTANRIARLRTIEHALVSHPEGFKPKDLCMYIGLTSKNAIRTLQNDLNDLRGLYIGNQSISQYHIKLELRDGDLAFPEAEFTASDRKQLNSICRLIAFFDGAVPIKEMLNVSVKEAEKALQGMSESIDVATNVKEIKYIKEIFDAIENHQILDVLFARLNNGKEFPFAPYLLKRFNNKWFVIGRMYVDNPFDWTVIPLAAIPILNKHKGDCKYIPKKDSEIRELKQRIRAYYDKVMGFHVPTNETDPDKVPRCLNPTNLAVEDICIRYSPRILRLIKENPIHTNQCINDDASTVSLQLVINPLLINRILSYGDEVEVLKPLSLRDAIKSKVERMALIYGTN